MPQTFAERLREEERRIGCNSRQACELLFGLSYKTYMNWLHGARTPNESTQGLVLHRLSGVEPLKRVVRSMKDLPGKGPDKRS